MEITNQNTTLSVNLSGGRIGVLKLNGILLLGTYTRIDGAEASSHVCIPNFDTEGMEEYHLPKHGPFRNITWEHVDSTDHSITIRARMDKEGTYPSALEATQIFSIDEQSFTHTVTIANNGNREAPVNIAYHYYWDAPNGWEGLMMGGTNVSDLVRKDTYTDLSEKTSIKLPGQPEIIVTTVGCKYAQLWTGRIEQRGHMQYDHSYVCIEPFVGKRGYFGSPDSMVPPNGTKTATVTLSLQ